ncbi:MAG: hypothetical protein GY806_19815, partial [Gammaproteobacteria bacterium]|nr:hypothetical protein [Gammaproteobacteria bacterium]
MKIRFMADASSDQDDVYIDEIVVTATTTPLPPSSPYATHTVRDEFNNDNWDNNDGDTDWLAPWADFLSAGDIDIENGAMQMYGTVDYSSSRVSRSIYMKDAITATLSFNYQRNFVSNSLIRVSLHESQGSFWLYQVYEIQGTGADTIPQQVT